MMHKAIKFFAICALSFLPLWACAQQKQSEEEEIEQMRTAIDQEIETYVQTLKLEDWQVFYVDSILTHDYDALRREMRSLREAKVSGNDVYVRVQDKWAEQIYQSFRKVFNDTQWNKYTKGSAGREKKARDKRAAK